MLLFIKSYKQLNNDLWTEHSLSAYHQLSMSIEAFFVVVGFLKLEYA